MSAYRGSALAKQAAELTAYYLKQGVPSADVEEKVRAQLAHGNRVVSGGYDMPQDRGLADLQGLVVRGRL